MNFKDPKTKKYITLFTCGFNILLCLTILVLDSYITFGWFSQNRSVSANGINVTIQGNKPIYITQGTPPANSENDTSILTFTGISPESIASVTHDGITTNEKKVEPGTYGSIVFNVSCADATTLNATFPIYQYASGNDLNVSEITNNCDKFISHHLAIFRERTGTAGNYQYNGWVNPAEVYEITLGEECNTTVTLYWCWIETYEQALNPNFIADNDLRTDITNNPSNWLFYMDELPIISAWSDAYNEADTVIGTQLQHVSICIGINIANISISN